MVTATSIFAAAAAALTNCQHVRSLAGRTAKLPKGVATEDDSDTVCMSTARFASTTNGKQGRHYPS